MTNASGTRRHAYLLFELTKRCQNNCVFCYNVWKEDANYPRGELTTKDAKYLLQKVIEESGCEYLGLTGGEPLLREDAFEISSLISSKGVTPVLISNGKLLTRETVQRCMDSGIRYFEISLHSRKADVHDKLAGRKGSFEEVIDAILNVRNLGGQVNTVFVATKENIGAFKEYVELAALLGVSSMLFNRVACGGACIASWKDLAPSPAEIREALDVGAVIAEKYKISLSAGVQLQPCLIDLTRYKNVRSGFCPLNSSSGDNSYFAIDPAGNLRMCNRSRIILGNLLEDAFAEISSSKEVLDFCEAVPDFCLDCTLSKVCAGGCKADAFSCFGSLSKADPYLEMWKGEAKKV